MSSKALADFLLLLVALIWGTTFPIVKTALVDVEPMWFLAIRFAFAALLLMPFFARSLLNAPVSTWKDGIIIGIFLFAGYTFQTVGLTTTTASKAAFITGLYVVIVPVINTVLTKRWPGARITLGVLSAVVGLALLSLEGRLVPELGDVLVLFCAFCFAFHIIAVAAWSPRHNAGALTTIQIATASVLSLIASLLFETPTLGLSAPAWRAIMLTGFVATSVAFLIQNSVQKFTTATHAAIIMALEPVFAVTFSYLWLGEMLQRRGAIGAVLMFSGMLLAELEPVAKHTSHKPKRQPQRGSAVR